MINPLADSFTVKWAEGQQWFSNLAACGPVSCLHLHPVLAKSCWLDVKQFKVSNISNSDKENTNVNCFARFKKRYSFSPCSVCKCSELLKVTAHRYVNV